MAVQWLAASAPEPLRLGPRCSTLPRTSSPFDEGAGDGWMEMLDLDLGVHLCRVTHRFASGQAGLRPMSEVHAELAEPIFFVQSTRLGSGVLHDRRVGLRLAHDTNSCVFAHLDRIDHQHLAEADARLEVTAVSMERSRLAGLLGDAAAQDLLLALDIAQAPSAGVRPVPRHIKSVLEAAPRILGAGAQSGLQGCLRSDRLRLCHRPQARRRRCPPAHHPDSAQGRRGPFGLCQPEPFQPCLYPQIRRASGGGSSALGVTAISRATPDIAIRTRMPARGAAARCCSPGSTTRSPARAQPRADEAAPGASRGCSAVTINGSNPFRVPGAAAVWHPV